MPLTEHLGDKPIHIQSMTPVSVTINEKIYTESLLITADYRILPWNDGNLSPLLEGKPEVVLIGTGESSVFLQPADCAIFYERGIGVEVMTTPAAVRTYTILISEERKVGVALKIGSQPSNRS